MQRIGIYYCDKSMPLIEMPTNNRNWIDLYTAEDVTYKAGDTVRISLGVIIKVPPMHEAILAPRSSTFKRYGLIQTNSIGVIDESYCGVTDTWIWEGYATRDGFIPKHSRICQFRIQQRMMVFDIVDYDPVEQSRGGFGSTGF